MELRARELRARKGRMAQVRIQSFFEDEEGHFVAQLSCGHTQHMRHRPPLESRPWVLSAEEREKKLGAPLDCSFCDMPSLPPDVSVYKVTNEFTDESVPVKMTQEHSTGPGVWGRIVVLAGRVTYLIPSLDRSWVLRPGVDGILVPEQVHKVLPGAGARFRIEFLRRPTEGVEDGKNSV